MVDDPAPSESQPGLEAAPPGSQTGEGQSEPAPESGPVDASGGHREFDPLAIAGLVLSVIGNFANAQGLVPDGYRSLLSVLVLLLTVATVYFAYRNLARSRRGPTGLIKRLIGKPVTGWGAEIRNAFSGRSALWVTIIIAALGVSAWYHRVLLAPLLPGLYERESARRALNRYFMCVNNLLAQKGDGHVLDSYRCLHEEVIATNTSLKYLKRDAREVGCWNIANGESETELRGKFLADNELLRKPAHAFVNGFGRISRVTMVGEPVPQQHLSLNAGVQRWFVTAQMEGDFIIDQFCEDLKIDEVVSILTQNDSQLRQRFLAMVRELYPEAKAEAVLAAFGRLPAHRLIYRDLPVQLARGNPDMGELDEEEYQNGFETIWYSIELVNVHTPQSTPWYTRWFSNGWRVEEIGVWGTRRQRGDGGRIHRREWAGPPEGGRHAQTAGKASETKP